MSSSKTATIVNKCSQMSRQRSKSEMSKAVQERDSKHKDCFGPSSPYREVSSFSSSWDYSRTRSFNNSESRLLLISSEGLESKQSAEVDTSSGKGVSSLCKPCCSSEEKSWTQDQKVTFVILIIGTLTASFGVCLFPPFFPLLAENKNCPYWMLGIIIGMSCLVSFILTPFLGKYLDKIGCKFAFVCGSVLSSGCCALSGFLQFFPQDISFIVESILLRAVHAAGNALVIVSTFTYVAVIFPDSVATTFAWTRTAMNVAQCIGPIFAGALIDFYGFVLPFIVMGFVQFVTALFSGYYLNELDGKSKSKEKASLLSIICIPAIWVSFYACIISTVSNGFLTINLEPQVLRQFHLPNSAVGALFGLKDGANSLVSPLWGLFCDKGKPKIVVFISALLAAVSFALIGPFPGLPFNLDILGCTIALILNGAAISGLQVGGMIDAHRTAMGRGLPDNSATHGMVAGIWTSLSSGGRFISRAGASFAVDQYGFRNSSVIVFFLHVSVMAFLLLFWMVFSRKADANNDSKMPSKDALGVKITKHYDKVTRKYSRLVSMSFATSPGEPLMSKSLEILTVEDIYSSPVARRVTTSDIDYISGIP